MFVVQLTYSVCFCHILNWVPVCLGVSMAFKQKGRLAMLCTKPTASQVTKLRFHKYQVILLGLSLGNINDTGYKEAQLTT